MKRVTSFFIAFFFLISVCPGTSVGGGVQSNQVESLLSAILSKYAVIEDVSGQALFHSTLDQPFVVLVQDIHAEMDAQMNINKSISSIEERLGPATVLTEGGSGLYETTFFSSSPNPEAVKTVLERYVRSGELSGAEYAAATHRTDSTYEGMEDWTLYLENRDLMREGIGRFDEVKKQLDVISKMLSKLAETVLPEELIQLRKSRELYQAGEINALGYVERLERNGIKNHTSSVSVDEVLFPRIVQLIKISAEWTEDLNRRADQEKKALIKEIEKKGKFTPSDFSDYSLVELADSLAIDETLMSFLRQRAGLNAQLQKIQGLSFVEELGLFENQVFQRAAISEESLLVWNFLERFELIQKLYLFALSRTEADIVLGDSELYDLKNLQTEILEKFPLVENGRVYSSEWTNNLVYLKFYQKAISREGVFKENIERALKKSKGAVVVVVGGFHSGALAEFLKRNKIAYLSLIPKINESVNNELYFKLMGGEGYSYLGPVNPRPIAGALALATVLTYVSNPEHFERFLGKTGQEIYDELMFERLEKDPFQVLSEWAQAIETSEYDQKLLRAYEIVLSRLYIREALRYPEIPMDPSQGDYQKLIKNINRIFGNVFLENGNSEFSAAKKNNLLRDIATQSKKPTFGMTDLILIVYSGRWGIPYEEVKEGYKRYLKFELLPEDQPLTAYQRLNETVFRVANLNPVIRNNRVADLLRVNADKTFREFLNENPLENLSEDAALLASFARFRAYDIDSPISLALRDKNYFSGRRFVGDSLLSPRMRYFPDRLQVGSKRLMFIPEKKLSPQVQNVYDLVTDAIDRIRSEVLYRYQAVLLDDKTHLEFNKNLRRLSPETPNGQYTLWQLKELLKKAPIIAEGMKRVDYKRESVASAMNRLIAEYSLEAMQDYRDTDADLAEYYLDVASLARGKRRQEIEAYNLTWLRGVGLNERIQRLIVLADRLAGVDESQAIYQILNGWLKESRRNSRALWYFVYSQNFDLQIKPHIVSDPDFDNVWYPSFMAVGRSFQEMDTGVTVPGVLPISKENYQLVLMKKQDRLFIKREFMERLSGLIAESPELGVQVANDVIDGVLREELEAHEFPLGVYSLFHPFSEDLQRRLDGLLAEVEFDRGAAELDLRIYDTVSRELRNRIDDEEMIAKLVRGDDDAEKLIRHYGSIMFIQFGFPYSFSKEFFVSQIRDYFYLSSSEFSWVNLKMPGEEQTYGKAIEREAVRIFDEWQKNTGRSLGQIDEEILSRGIDDLVKVKNPRSKDFIFVMDVIRGGTVNEPGMFENRVEENDPMSEWYKGRERGIRNSAVLKAFLADNPGLRAESETDEILGDTEFGKMLDAYSARSARASAVHILPDLVPDSVEGVEDMARAVQEDQTVYFYISKMSKLGELIGKAKKRSLDLIDALHSFKLKKFSKKEEVARRLNQELARNLKKGEGVSVFTAFVHLFDQMPVTEKINFVVVQNPTELKKFPWLNEKIKEIGFILPALSDEEAAQFSKELSLYGIGFETTQRGVVVTVRDLDQLLKKLTTEFEAARSRAIAA